MSVNNPNFVAVSELTSGLADDYVDRREAEDLPPDTYLFQSVPRNSSMANTGILSSGRETHALCYGTKGSVVRQVAYWSGTTALATATNQWFTVRDLNRNLLGVTVDDTSNAWAANTEKILTLTNPTTGVATPIILPYTGFYYVGVMVAATTVPTLIGPGNLTAICTKPPIAAGFSNSGLTTPSTAPAQSSVISPVGNIPYAALL